MALDNTERVSIEICTDPWEHVEVDAFVCATNSQGIMSHHPARKLKELAGVDIEEQVLAHTPLAIGAALVTGAGCMKAKHLVHVANTPEPGGPIQVEDILRATSAVIIACTVKGFHSIAMPLMGAFRQGIPAEEAARAIHSEFRSYRGDHIMQVLLMANDGDEVEVFEMAIEGTG